MQVYTDDSDFYGSGVYIKSKNHDIKIQKQNSDLCFVFHSELIVKTES